MIKQPFAVNKNIEVAVDYIGNEKTPVVTIDHFSENPNLLVELAVNGANFNNATGDKNYYPGELALVDKGYRDSLYEALKPVIRNVYKQPVAYPDWIESTYAIVTTPPEKLVKMQCLPHYDSMGPHQLAILHYLCDKPHRGTAFYRHRATGFETIQKAREEEYWSHVNPILEAEKYDSIYLDGSNDDYEKIGEFELKFNRLVIYPSQILHSSLINPAALTGNVAAGRLTLRTFVAY